LGKTQGDIDGTVRQTGLGQKNNPNNQMKRKRKKRKEEAGVNGCWRASRLPGQVRDKPCLVRIENNGSKMLICIKLRKEKIEKKMRNEPVVGVGGSIIPGISVVSVGKCWQMPSLSVPHHSCVCGFIFCPFLFIFRDKKKMGCIFIVHVSGSLVRW
jgi:hypothetical protein